MEQEHYILGYTVFYKSGFKTFYKHFDSEERLLSYILHNPNLDLNLQNFMIYKHIPFEEFL